MWQSPENCDTPNDHGPACPGRDRPRVPGAVPLCERGPAEKSGMLLRPFKALTSSWPPTAATYFANTSIVTLRDRSIAAIRGWLTPIASARSRCDTPASSRRAVKAMASRSSDSIRETRAAAPGFAATFFSHRWLSREGATR